MDVAKKGKSKKTKKVVKQQEQKFGFSINLDEEEPEIPQQRAEAEDPEGFKVIQSVHIEVEREEPPPEIRQEEPAPEATLEEVITPIQKATESHLHLQNIEKTSEKGMFQNQDEMKGHEKVGMTDTKQSLEKMQISAVERIEEKQDGFMQRQSEVVEEKAEEEPKVSPQVSTEVREAETNDPEDDLGVMIGSTKVEKKKREGGKPATKKKTAKSKITKSVSTGLMFQTAIEQDPIQQSSPKQSQEQFIKSPASLKGSDEENKQQPDKINDVNKVQDRIVQPVALVQQFLQQQIKDLGTVAQQISRDIPPQAVSEVKYEQTALTQERDWPIDQQVAEVVTIQKEKTEEISEVHFSTSAPKKGKKSKKKDHKPKKTGNTLNTNMFMQETLLEEIEEPIPTENKQKEIEQPEKEIKVVEAFQSEEVPEENLPEEIRQNHYKQTNHMEESARDQVEEQQQAAVSSPQPLNDIREDPIPNYKKEEISQEQLRLPLQSKPEVLHPETIQEEQIQIESLNLAISKKKSKKESKKTTKKNTKQQSLLQVTVIEENIAVQNQFQPIKTHEKHEEQRQLQTIQKEENCLPQQRSNVEFEAEVVGNTAQDGNIVEDVKQPSAFTNPKPDDISPTEHQHLDKAQQSDQFCAVEPVYVDVPTRKEQQTGSPESQQQPIEEYLEIQVLAINPSTKPKKGTKKTASKIKTKAKMQDKTVNSLIVDFEQGDQKQIEFQGVKKVVEKEEVAEEKNNEVIAEEQVKRQEVEKEVLQEVIAEVMIEVIAEEQVKRQEVLEEETKKKEEKTKNGVVEDYIGHGFEHREAEINDLGGGTQITATLSEEKTELSHQERADEPQEREQKEQIHSDLPVSKREKKQEEPDCVIEPEAQLISQNKQSVGGVPQQQSEHLQPQLLPSARDEISQIVLIPQISKPKSKVAKKGQKKATDKVKTTKAGISKSPFSDILLDQLSPNAVEQPIVKQQMQQSEPFASEEPASKEEKYKSSIKQSISVESEEEKRVDAIFEKQKNVSSDKIKTENMGNPSPEERRVDTPSELVLEDPRPITRAAAKPLPQKKEKKKSMIVAELVQMVNFQVDQEVRIIRDRLAMLEQDVRSRLIRKQEFNPIGPRANLSEKMKLYTGIIEENIALREESRLKNVEM